MTTQPSYEELYSELELTIERLESGELSLDEALKCYERGLYLSTTCQEVLESAELRVQQLLDGTLVPLK